MGLIHLRRPDRVQGFLFSGPGPPEQIVALLSARELGELTVA